MNVPSAVVGIVQKLNRAGYEAYPVGGCVRDLLRGEQPHDWDITTSATPEEILAVFSDEKTIPTGLKHGTVTVMKNGVPFEVTSYRVDGDYTDGRHPDSVRFTRSLKEDLARRDFTVNAMAMDIENGVVDPFFGLRDLESKTLRCVGNPDDRFEEDALRILRALRFSSVLGFAIEPKTAASIHRNAHRLSLVSAERITEEFTKLLCGSYVANVCREFVDVLEFLIPEISPLIGFSQHSPYHDRDIFEHTLASVAAAKPQSVLRWTMLLHDIGKAECFTLDENGVGHFYGHATHSVRLSTDVLSRFKLSNKDVERILLLVKIHDLPLPPDEVLLTKRLRKFGKDVLLQLLDVQDADCLAQSPEWTKKRLAEHQQVREMLEKLALDVCYRLSDLAVDGRDLQAAGFPAGPALGKALDELLEAVIEKRVANEKTALLAYIKNKPN
ncbi:MAG: HD domain-containing protein [Clostridia bacterium]|nr:HD domain-containing protein [Clostridia bacterium]